MKQANSLACVGRRTGGAMFAKSGKPRAGLDSQMLCIWTGEASPSQPTNGSLAQLVEQRPEEPCVPSSSLGGATNAGVAQLLERFLAKEEATS